MPAASQSLRGIRLLQSLSAAELGALEQRCRWRRAEAGQEILDRSTDNRDVFFVVEGSVRAVDLSPSGREVVYAVIGAAAISASCRRSMAWRAPHRWSRSKIVCLPRWLPGSSSP